MIEIQSVQQFYEIKRTCEKPVIIEFSAKWCEPCQKLAPYFEELSQKYQEIQFCKVDVDIVRGVFYKNKVKQMPSFVGFYLGQKIDGIIGESQEQLISFVEQFL